MPTTSLKLSQSVMIAMLSIKIQVTVLDLSAKQIAGWNSADLPIYEPGLDEVSTAQKSSECFRETLTR